MTVIEGWAALTSTTGGTAGLELVARGIVAADTPAVRCKYYITALGPDGAEIWEFGLGTVVGTSLQKRDVIDSSADGGPIDFPRTGATVFLSDPIEGAVAPGGDGSGDVTGPASSTNNRLVQFNGTTGKAVKEYTGTGLLKVTSGVPSAAVAETDYVTPSGLDSAIAGKADASAVATALAGKSDTGHTHVKSEVGLSNVDNTADADKPVSTATQTALNGKQATLVSGSNIKTVNSTSLMGSGDVAISATPADGSVTLAKLVDQVEATVIGRAAGAGTGPPTALSAAQIRAAAEIQEDDGIVWAQVFIPGELGVGDAQGLLRIPPSFNGWDLVAVGAGLLVPGSTGAVTIQVRNVTSGEDMLSTPLTIDASESDSITAVTAAVIDTTKDDVATGNLLAVDLDGVRSGTPAEGLVVSLGFKEPVA